MGGCIQSGPLFIVFVRNEHVGLPQKKAQANGEHLANLYCRAVKKKTGHCGDDRLHKAGMQAIQASTTDVKGTKPQRQDY
jgi:hypothetical protein